MAGLLLIPLVAAMAAEPEVKIDPRLERLAVVHSLAALDKPVRGFAFNSSVYSELAKKTFLPFKKHAAVKKYLELVKGGMDFVTASKLAMQDDAQLAFLADFGKDSNFAGFLQKSRSAHETMLQGMRDQMRGHDYVWMLQEYTGQPVQATYSIVLCPLCDEPEGSNFVTSSGTATNITSTLGPPFDYQEERLAIWHEIGHTILDPLQKAHPESLKATEPLFDTVADCCRGSWHDCAREHLAQGLAYAVWEWARRTGHIKEGPASPRQKKEPAYIRQVVARYKEFEGVRANEQKNLADFYPRLMDVFTEILHSKAGKAGHNAACKASTRF